MLMNEKVYVKDLGDVGMTYAIPFFKQIFKNNDQRVNDAKELLPYLEEIEDAEVKSEAKTEAKERKTQDETQP